jgi:hypothetical protein
MILVGHLFEVEAHSMGKAFSLNHPPHKGKGEQINNTLLAPSLYQYLSF